MSNNTRSMLIDITRCVGCGACTEACLQAHDLTTNVDDIKDLSAGALTFVSEKDDLYVRRMCMHCLEPTCVSVCPVGALQQTQDGPVIYEASRCLGCRYCMQACPFNVPRYEWNKVVPGVAKCDFCAPRQAQGLMPACAEACPEDATTFGTREEMLAEAHRRINENPGAYYPHVFGEEELGGTSMLILSPVPFDTLGYPKALPHEPLSSRTWASLSHVPDVITVGGAMLLAIWWITKRREEVARIEGPGSSNDMHSGGGHA
ncbi:MAG: 4Fe-4S dicluster domain-containing protein [Candidatus Krumholzibacteria bacterium]|nr:4Fe-4S dicluster domain-containing protein [Candidatus Krumholzibacteria bacterium]MDH4336250.1 4Fe-4S dicluster domain-containing protein [Candidatus Krumholzibacteria bacterium]MDH5269711.1 4Fe-4S dicluster domain-containing protein [Candidatus Krumholzibacteria bacterium]MDH5627597.1 4Fe-4S dicluster domain-containing protein [Candidatus Krumholzibacteria bacterium]